MLNNIDVQGRLTKDPELKQTRSDSTVCSVSIACERDNGKKEVDFIRITAFGKTAEHIAKYFHKGSMILINGRLQINEYTDKEGNRRMDATVMVNRVYFPDSKGGSQRSVEPEADAEPMPTEAELQKAYHQQSMGGDFRPYREYEDEGELPF